jgi:hypothetical protein
VKSNRETAEQTQHQQQANHATGGASAAKPATAEYKSQNQYQH